jgi:hypothetical protein
VLKTEARYTDSFVTITDDTILFRRYGLLGGNKSVSLVDIEKIVIKKPTVWNGKWRLHGTGDFRTWFPMDYNRQKRDYIFVAYIRNKWWRIGFTVENSSRVASILGEKGLADELPEIPLAGTFDTSNQSESKPDRTEQTKRNIFLYLILLNAVIIPLILILYFLIRKI